MMKRYNLLLGALFAASSFTNAQNTSEIIEANDAKVYIHDGGIFFNNYAVGEPGYEIPAGSGKHAIYDMSFWYGAIDGGGTLHFAGHTYEGEQDLWSGPLTADGTAEDVNDGSWNPGVFKVSKAEIDDFKENWDDDGYIIPESIANWPGNGDVALNQANDLAPYVDVDENNLYEPENGDYPCIPGDGAVFLILNDKRSFHGTGSEPLGIEVHYLFYQYNEPALENTTFLSMKVINRSTVDLADFRAAMFVDFDLGDGGDDHIGTNSDQNLLYAYNGNAADGVYGTTPPAIGVVSLNYDAFNAGYEYPAPFEDFIPSHMWGYMNSYNQDGTHWVDPVLDEEVNFMFDGKPEDLSGSSEVENASLPGDRKAILTIAVEDGIPASNGEVTFDYAIVYADHGISNLNNVTKLFEVTETVQAFYDTYEGVCDTDVASIENEEENTLSIYPNPSTGSFTIDLPSTTNAITVTVSDISGRVVYTETVSGTNQLVIALNESPGTYMVHLNNNEIDQTALIAIK